MDGLKKRYNQNDFEVTIREYLRQGRQKLENDLAGTREAIKLIAKDKIQNFIKNMDKGLDKVEREYLRSLIISSMHQAFCYGYSIGKFEGRSNSKVFL